MRPRLKVGLREKCRHLNSCKANVIFANERPVAAVNSATWTGSAVKSVKIKNVILSSHQVFGPLDDNS